jgi:hypothetical protein
MFQNLYRFYYNNLSKINLMLYQLFQYFKLFNSHACEEGVWSVDYQVRKCASCNLYETKVLKRY